MTEAESYYSDGISEPPPPYVDLSCEERESMLAEIAQLRAENEILRSTNAILSQCLSLQQPAYDSNFNQEVVQADNDVVYAEETRYGGYPQQLPAHQQGGYDVVSAMTGLVAGIIGGYYVGTKKRGPHKKSRRKKRK